LKDIIESPNVDEFIRSAALEAMAYLSAHGALGEDSMRDYLLRLFAQMQPQDENYVWVSWASSAANLGYEDLVSKVEGLYHRGFIDRMAMGFDDFQKQLRRTLDDPERKAGFTYDRIAPFEDAIGTLSTWYGFSEEAKMDWARRLAEMTAESFRPVGGSTQVNLHRDVGRNDPCPVAAAKNIRSVA
jgi:hypothetical protein